LVFVKGSVREVPNQVRQGSSISEMYNSSNAPHRANFDVLAHTPSITMSTDKFGIGIYSAARSVLSLTGLPNHLANHIRNGFSFPDQLTKEFTTTNLRLGSISWLEYGLNASSVISQDGRSVMTIGVSLKLLNGITGVGMNINKWNYQVENDSILNSIEFIGKYGVHDFENSSNLLGNGRGLGADLGFNYKSMKSSVSRYSPRFRKGCKIIDYDYKFGISVLDIGSIKFNNGLTRTFEVSDSVIWENYNDTNLQSLSGLNDLVSNELLMSQEANVRDAIGLKMLLPTAVSAQFDYNVGYGFYANATLVHGLSRKKKLGVERTSIFAITPRFESKSFDISLPIVIRSYESVRLGVAFRLYYITLGSDNIFSLLGRENRETYGTDFYFNLKYTMFRPWYCKKSKVNSRLKRRKGSNPCPSW
jgi:hypothetical protein